MPDLTLFLPGGQRPGAASGGDELGNNFHVKMARKMAEACIWDEPTVSLQPQTPVALS